MKKSGLACRLFIFSLAMLFFLSFGPIVGQTQAAGAEWKKVRACHDGLRATMKNCAKNNKSKCAKSALKKFKKCVQTEAKGAKLKKGSSYKKLSKSVQAVVDAVQPLFRKCYDQTSDFEKKEVAKAKKKTTDKDEFKKEVKKIQKEAEKLRGECFSTAQKMSNKALEAQVGQHFE